MVSDGLISAMPSWFDELPGSWKAAPWLPPFEGLGNQQEQIPQGPVRMGEAQKETRQDRSDGGNGIGRIGREASLLLRRQGRVRQISKGRHQIPQPDLGQEILSDGDRQFPGEMLDRQTALEHLEALLDAPAAVVKRSELAGREGGFIQQGSDQELLLSRRQAHTNQAHGKATFPDRESLGSCLAYSGGRHLDLNDSLRRPRLEEGRELRHAGDAIADPHAEMALVFDQPGKQPIGRKPPVQQQKIISTHMRQAVRQHLPFPGTRCPQIAVYEQAAGHVHQAKDLGQGGLSTPAVAMHTELVDDLRQGRQTQGGGIARQQSEAVPTRHGDALLPLAEQQLVESPKGRGQEFLTGLGESAFGDGSDQMSPIGEAAEKIVQFALQASRHAAGQTADQRGERKRAATGEVFRTGPVFRDELVRGQGRLDFGHQCGMEVAKSFSCIPLNNNYFAVRIIPYSGLNLTALGPSPMPLS